MRFLFLTCYLLLFSFLSAQQTKMLGTERRDSVAAVSIGTITPFTQDSTQNILGLQEIKDEKIDLLIEDYTKNKKISGYRIQIFASSSNRWEAVKARSEFLKKYPDEKSYLVYQAPNYKVRIGDYTTRLKAHESLELIKIDFPSAFIVADEVDPKIKISTEK